MRIAIVGTGIAGLGAAWLLDRAHEVHVFEREPRLGGHTHTHDVRIAGAPVAVDTGFLVYNEVTYPNLTRLFAELDVATQASDMSLSVRCERCDLEYAGSPGGLVADRRNLIDPRMYRLVRDVLRFHGQAKRVLGDPRLDDMDLQTYLDRSGLGRQFADHYLLPMAAAIWSSGTDTVTRFPVGLLLRFLENHGLLGITTHHPWRTVTGGARSYIGPLTAGFRDRIHTGDAVVAVSRPADGGIDLRTASGTTDHFDKVVLAAHADESLALLSDPSADEKELLGAWDYSSNDTWLHTDAAQLPAHVGAWASWNYRLQDCRGVGGAGTEAVSVSYHLNRLQSLDVPEDVVVTLNPSQPIPRDRVLRRMSYTHPVYTPEAVATQAALQALSGTRDTLYAGAYLGYGFHEDGLVSAVRAAAELGVSW